MGNYIKISRNILEWEWYKNLNTCRLFFHLILKANWKDGRFEGKDIPTGSFVSSISKLSDETGLTQREVRTAINHLKTTGELTVKGHAKYSIFTVNNYYRYQESDKQNGIQTTNNRHTSDTQAPGERHSNDIQSTTIEEGKKEKREEVNNLCKAEALSLFERLWQIYPSKKGKGQVSLAAKQRLLKVGYEEMVRAIDRYRTELEKDSDWRKPQNGSTFFNSGYMDYLDSNYVDARPDIEIDMPETTKLESNQNTDLEEELIDDEEWWKYGPNAWEG
ncbi:hypothetical protein [uncultured Bacteroides sp.]|uniref:hypothetical protein n=1 Tax=uncultured Bacteroides sp. TaxID=162156 RepID=UPI00260171FE|nr:hypothetical protein [uncultured Bacteroides sp.]